MDREREVDGTYFEYGTLALLPWHWTGKSRWVHAWQSHAIKTDVLRLGEGRQASSTIENNDTYMLFVVSIQTKASVYGGICTQRGERAVFAIASDPKNIKNYNYLLGYTAISTITTAMVAEDREEQISPPMEQPQTSHRNWTLHRWARVRKTRSIFVCSVFLPLHHRLQQIKSLQVELEPSKLPITCTSKHIFNQLYST